MPRALGAIRREHLEAFFVALGELGIAPATISILFRALRPFWRWLVEEDKIERTPMERMRAPSVPLNPPRVLSDEQSALLLAACRGTDLIARRDLAMLSLLLDRDPPRRAGRRERARLLRAALDRLSRDQRIALVLYAVHGLEYEEIVLATAAPIGTVKSRIHRARLALRELMVEHRDLFTDA